MDEIKERKNDIRENVKKKLGDLPQNERVELNQSVENRLFEFANFIESKIPLLYLNNGNEVPTRKIIEKSLNFDKIVVLPKFYNGNGKSQFKLFKIDDPNRDLKPGPTGVLEPDDSKCKAVPVDRLDIAIIPGIALDEKGGRIGTGKGNYDRLIPRLPVTTRKVALVLETQIVPQIPMQSHDKHVDIVISEKRVIYKI